MGISCRAVSFANMYINIVYPKCMMLIGAKEKETAILEIATSLTLLAMTVVVAGEAQP